jgi:carboxylesterase type B
MKDVERYRKDLDLVFQELDEKEQLQRQAESQPYAEFIVGLLRYKNIQDLLRSMPLDDKKQVIDACWQAKLAYDKAAKKG